MLDPRFVRPIAGIALGLTLLAPTIARATDPSDTERARALFDEAGSLERQGRWGAAQDRLRQALKLRETPQLYYALGWALENEDKLLEAKADYETTVRLAAGKPNAEEAARLAKDRLAELEKMMPTIRVKIGGARSNARVIVDGREAKREDDVATIAVNPGSHVLRVERAGADEALEEMVYVGRKETREVTIDAPDVAVRDTNQERHGSPAPRVASPSSDGPSVLPWAILGGSVAFLAGSAALFVASSANADDRDMYRGRWCNATACHGTTATKTETPEAAADRRAAADAASSGNTKQVAAFALGGVGIVGAAIGAYLLVARHHEAPRVAKRNASERWHGVNVANVLGGAMATAGWRF